VIFLIYHKITVINCILLNYPTKKFRDFTNFRHPNENSGIVIRAVFFFNLIFEVDKNTVDVFYPIYSILSMVINL
jgi:hypothetical protein